MKVFISSLISGMEEFRDAAARAARALRHEVIRAEDFGASPSPAQITCLNGVRDSDVVVLIVGARYGTLQSSGKSATHEEYDEARERCPILVMVQDGVERDPEQAVFLEEVQDWAQGHFTASFGDPEQLRDAVTGALHDLELTSATGDVDADETLQRALDLIPLADRGSYHGGARVAFALTGAPHQTILRPAELEEQAFRDRLLQLALIGDAAVLSTDSGTRQNIVRDALVLEQERRSVSVSENGSIVFAGEVPTANTGMSVIIEEDIRDLIGRFLKFSDTLLDQIDPVQRLSHCVVAAAILDVGYMTWRTRDEHARSPNSVNVNVFGQEEPSAVYLSPPHRPRPALRLNAHELAEDFTVKLRRQLQNPDQS